jgi:osmoprotectant transport system ATP-binding protein
VTELLELIGLPSDMGRRYPAQLSGGQRQRVGVARALAADPPVMLMDEPFGAIDPINRERLQNEFLRLQAELRKTVVFVTHDIDEAIKIGDRIAVMQEGGVLAQYAAPAELLMRPANAFVEDFVGADRALKRLALQRVRDVELLAPDGSLDGPVLAPDTLLRDALSDLLAHEASRAQVVEPDGRVLGVLSIDLVARALATTPEDGA